ncbi:MAG: TonB-dependent receptor [Saprospiraceae bacterium]|nr:TonB-dependent receptor [Saprospiraceae bacterium]
MLSFVKNFHHAKTARLLAFLLSNIALVAPLFAQQETTDTLIVNELQPVTVTAYRLKTSDLATPLSITTIGQRQLQNGSQQLALDEALAGVPGLFVQNGTNFAQDIRVSIRGFGARSQFGIRGVKILVDGFPESTPDGTAQVDAVDPGSLTGISVIRSGTGGLYGNASGGSVNFSTMKFNDEEWIEIGSSIGSYGFHKSQLRMGGGKANKFLYSINGSFTGTEGYREHSAMRNSLLNGGFLMPVDSSLTIRGVLTYVNSPVAQDPGGLDLDDIEEDRRSSNSNNEYFNVGESLWQLRMGIGLVKVFADRHILNTSFYQTNRSFSSRLFNDWVEIERSFTGGTFSYVFKTKPGRVNWEMTAGVDLEKQADDRKRYDNDEGEKEEQYAYQLETFASTGFFMVQKLDIGGRFFLLPSLRYDKNVIAVDDKFQEDFMDGDLRRNYHAWNPTLGISIQLSPNIYLFSNLGSNFETPTLLELGQSSENNLKPQKSKSIELGYKFLMANGTIRFEPTVFYIRLKDEFVVIEPNSGPPVLDNAGTSDRKGFEAAFFGQLTKHLYCSLNYTLSDFKFDEYEDYDGNVMPNIPRHQLGFMLNYAKPQGLSLTFGNNWISSIYADLDNEVKVKPYWYGYLKAAYSLTYKRNEIVLFCGINNLYNHWFNANIRVNSSRPFEPAPLRNYYAGIKFQF